MRRSEKTWVIAKFKLEQAVHERIGRPIWRCMKWDDELKAWQPETPYVFISETALFMLKAASLDVPP